MRSSLIRVRLAISLTLLLSIFIWGCHRKLQGSENQQATKTVPIFTATAFLPVPEKTVETPGFQNTLSRTPTVVTKVTPRNVNDLLTGEVGCQLPCMMDIEPGKTDWGTALEIVQSLNGYSEQRTVEINGEKRKIVLWYYPELWVNDVQGTVVGVDNKAVEVRMDTDMEKNNYHIGQILNTHGQPEQVLISTVGNAPSNTWQLYVILVYPSQRFITRNIMEAYREGDFVVACKEYSSVNIFAYSQDIEWTEKLVLEEFFGQDTYFKVYPISKVTVFDTQSFYNTFKEGSTSSKC